MINSIKLKRRRKHRKNSGQGNEKRRKRKLPKSEVQQGTLSPYLKPPAPPLRISFGTAPKRRKRLRRKNVNDQRRIAYSNESLKKSSKVQSQSVAFKMLDGLNRAARWSSEMILYLTFFALT